MKELESEAWEDFLDMTISQAILWASLNIAPEEKHSEIAACEPYFIGSHSGASGGWVSGPPDLKGKGKLLDEYFWGEVGNMTTVPGLFAAGDASGASSHKFSSGSYTEGRYTGKQAVKWILANNSVPAVDAAALDAAKAKVLGPMETYEKFAGYSSDNDYNPNYIKPFMFMFRLQKIMDEYAGGVSSPSRPPRACANAVWSSWSSCAKTRPSWRPRTFTNSNAAGKTSIACGRPKPTSAPSCSARKPGGRVTTSALTPPRWTTKTGWPSRTSSMIRSPVNGLPGRFPSATDRLIFRFDNSRKGAPSGAPFYSRAGRRTGKKD